MVLTAINFIDVIIDKTLNLPLTAAVVTTLHNHVILLACVFLEGFCFYQ